MRSALALLLALGVVVSASAQTPAPAQPAPAQPTPPSPAARPRVPRPAAPSTATVVLTVAVSDPAGNPLADVKVSAVGPVEREGVSTAAGQVRLLGIRPGTYRVRFERDGYYTFEKEVSWRAGTPAPVVEATLSAAPPPPPPPEPTKVDTPKPTPSPDMPAGKPTTMSLLDYIERNFISNKEPQKESLIGCSGGAQSWLWQVRDPWPNRKHDDAELMLYVVGGDGTLRLDDRDIQVAAGSFAVIPRATSYGFTRRGRNPLIMLATLSGAPCVQ
ncbi:MAG: carboxypeptidase regulatory-like domain-containing protein [Acidobacteriota bacterium]